MILSFYEMYFFHSGEMDNCRKLLFPANEKMRDPAAWGMMR